MRDASTHRHPFFAPLERESRRTIIKYLTLERYSKDQVVMLQDDDADCSFSAFFHERIVLC